MHRKAAMPLAAQPAERVRFDCFEANLATGELRKHGVRVKLHDQPFQILAMLVARPGEMVTREEIRQKLWPDGTFVDFENGMNRAVNRLRDALGDSADQPKFIETIPRHGYRFLAAVERLSGQVLATEAVRSSLVAQPSKPWRNWRWVAAAVAVILVAASFAGWRVRAIPRKSLNFGPRDWVLVTSFENRTGNPLFDGSLEYALARELSNSQYVTVVSPERVGDALRLMRKPPETRIDAPTGREICLRDGGIRAMLTGRIEKLGTVYVLSAQLMDPVRGVAVASLSEEDPADAQMAAAVRRLSNRVRETLGETHALVQESNQQLEKVTTPSLHALQLYTQANELMRKSADSYNQFVAQQSAATELLKQALADDPNFASAHLLLGYTYSTRGYSCQNPACFSEMRNKARAEFQRALELAGNTPDRERLFIQASYYHAVQRDFPKAMEIYEALLQLYPDHFLAADNLLGLYSDFGHWDEEWRLSARRADLRPDNLVDNERAACGLYVSKNLEAARPYIERARALNAALAAADPKGGPPFIDVAVEMLPVLDSWSQGDVSKAHFQFIQLENSDKNFAYPSFLWSFGEIAEANRRTKALTDDVTRDLLLGVSAYITGDLPAAKKYFQNHLSDLHTRWEPPFGDTSLALMVRSGLSDRVEAAIRDSPPTSAIEIVRGELAIAHGQTAKGVALLEKGLEDMQMHAYHIGAYYFGSETLARAYEKQGKLDMALRVLQKAADTRELGSPCQGLMSGAFWLRIKLQLADLYRKMNRVPEAEQVEDELRKMLIYADLDHPIVLALKKRENLSARAAQTH